ncbi:MAG: hypothetical protein N3B21_15655 [Clostridia bacterium]|nr:hypothetical protein [Clostridia bacterium]
MMIYATADTNPCIPIDNLPTVHKHYETCTNLCSTTKDTLEACCNLSTATNLQQGGNRRPEGRSPIKDIHKAHQKPNLQVLTSKPYCLRNP